MRIIKFKPTYEKENGTMVIYGKSIPFPKNFTPVLEESGIVMLPPKAFGGNHFHPRIECFYALGDLTISWNENNQIKKDSMSPENGEYKLFITESGEPHVVVNNSDKNQVLVEFASTPQSDVIPANIL